MVYSQWRYRGIDPYEFVNGGLVPKPDLTLRYEAFMEGCARYAASQAESTTDLIEGIVTALVKKRGGKNRPRST